MSTVGTPRPSRAPTAQSAARATRAARTPPRVARRGGAAARPVRGEVHRRAEDAAVRVTAVRVDDPLFPPSGADRDAVLLHRDGLEAEPPVVGRAEQAGLQRFGCGDGLRVAHGATTTLPITLRSRM